MKSEKRLLVMLIGLVSGKHSALMIAQNNVRKTQKKLLKKADVFAEPISEIFNEFIDIIAVSFDEVKEAVFGSNEQNKAKTVETGMKVKTAPGRYARVKV
jgi:gas vesicle protein